MGLVFRARVVIFSLTLPLGMNSEKISPTLVAILDSLCCACPKFQYTACCPFGKFTGVSRPSRRSLFSQMDMAQTEGLFDLATDCTCPKDPRAAAPSGATARSA